MAFAHYPNLSIQRKNGPIPTLPYTKIRNTILGKDYELSIAFIPPLVAQELNKKNRNKSYVPNILSFPLEKKSGEIYICLSIARKEAKSFGMTYDKYLHFLLIHGCLHLEGRTHGSTMEKLEDSYLSSLYHGKTKRTPDHRN